MSITSSPLYGSGWERERQVPVYRSGTGYAYHDFLLLDDVRYPMGDYSEAFGDFHDNPAVFESTNLYDAILRTMHETLVWIPSHNPASRDFKAQTGLNYYGPTTITSEGAEMVRRVFRGWSGLYAAGPELIRIRGDFFFDEENETSYYETLVVSRGALLHVLDRVASFASRVMVAKGRLYLLHLGI